MENTQSVQQSSEVQARATETVTNKSKPQISGNFLIHLFAKCPWLFLGGLLAVFLSSGTVALYSLGYVGRVERQEPEFIQDVDLESSIPTPSETTNVANNSISLWMVGAIAMSCASGCFIIVKLLNYPVWQQKIHKSSQRHPSSITRRRHQKLEPSPSKNLPAFIITSVTKSPTTTKSEQSQPVITVLPPEENFNKDNQESLASMMDIRKQTSLSALLRD
ncbi:MAG: hypothetical protein N2235_11095 [Fischerella sp.]|nr:hypothetical protein [Fischerella sp.]